MFVSFILSLRASHVPVGEDQLQHLELAKDIAQSFNNGYSCNFFPEPLPILGMRSIKFIICIVRVRT